VKKIEAGWLEFDVALATPDLMGQVGRLGKILGRRGLMPNPKAGTITFDLDRAVREVKGGRVEFKVDKTAIVHVPVGKASFEPRRSSPTSPRSSMPSTAPSPRARRAPTCARSPSPARWAPAFEWTSRASSRPPRRPEARPRKSGIMRNPPAMAEQVIDGYQLKTACARGPHLA
jgi:hypothetical protein